MAGFAIRAGSARKCWISVWIILTEVDVFIGELVQTNRSEKRLRRLDQQDRPGKAVVVEAAPEMNARFDRDDLEGTDVQPEALERRTAR